MRGHATIITKEAGCTEFKAIFQTINRQADDDVVAYCKLLEDEMRRRNTV